MFDSLVFLLIIGFAATKVYRMVKTKREKEEQRLAEIVRNVKDYEQRRLERTRLKSTSVAGGSMLAAVAGGAATMFLLDHIMDSNNLDQQTLAQMQDMDLNQLQDFAMENQLMQQDEMNNLMDSFDPYTNPGVDQVVDEYYHGIDHGLDDNYHYGADDFSNDDFGMDDFGFDDFGGMDNNFGSGFDDFGGGFGGGFDNNF